MADLAHQRDRSLTRTEKPIKTTLGELIAALSEEAIPCSGSEEEANQAVAQILSHLLKGSSDASDPMRLNKADQIRVLKLLAEVGDVGDAEEKSDSPGHLRRVSFHK
jgi:hypothetical protein